jgi:hypothetical protein
VVELIDGLVPSTTYNYRIVATKGVETTYGANKTFTTLVGYSLKIGDDNPNSPGYNYNSWLARIAS